MKINNKSISIAFVIILAATVIISLAGMLLMNRQPLVLQGQVEATEIRISGKLPGRVDSFLVQEGDWVKAGDTLVVINSPTIEAKYRQVNALEQVAQEQNKKIDAGTRRQIVATARQLWNKTQSDLALAKTTYQRIVTLYKDSVVTSHVQSRPSRRTCRLRAIPDGRGRSAERGPRLGPQPGGSGAKHCR